MKKDDKTKKTDDQIARENWERYKYGRDRGHDTYIPAARRLEEFYLGGGRQWSTADRAAVEASGRPCAEVNTIFPAVNTAIGEQLHTRADISFRPRNSQTDQDTADALSKVAKQICDDIRYPWLESQIFADGLIQQRGFLELYVDFEHDALGCIAGCDLDPLDVIPDPDGNSYDPDTWSDVCVIKWMTLDEIWQAFGEKKAQEVEDRADQTLDSSDEVMDRPGFGLSDDTGATWSGDKQTTRYLIVYRQHRRHEMADVLIAPNGRIEIADRYTEPETADMLAQGHTPDKRIQRRIRWTVSTDTVLLHDDWSPYRTITIVPYFPYFRRGQTLGMIDNAVSPQELLNKSTSQFLHIINTSANSGWVVEQNSLVNMRPEDLERQGAKTGLVIEYKKGSQPPQKILPNQVPSGIDRMADKAELFIKTITGMSDAAQGLNGPEVSGIAIQAKQYQGKTQLAGPLDNLARTRNLVGRKLLELIQDFYTEERMFLITDQSDPTQTQYNELTINQQQPDGTMMNHVSVGEYDVVVTEQPMAATFEENQYRQALEMRKEGIGIPDAFIVESSSLSRKNDIVKALQDTRDPLAQAKAEEIQAKIRSMDAATERTQTEKVSKAVEAQYSAMQAANVIATTPQTAPMADALLRSAGFQDQDQAPIVPNAPPGMDLAGQPVDVPTNTNPLTPANPGVGLNQGIETPANDMGTA